MLERKKADYTVRRFSLSNIYIYVDAMPLASILAHCSNFISTISPRHLTAGHTVEDTSIIEATPPPSRRHTSFRYRHYAVSFLY